MENPQYFKVRKNGLQKWEKRVREAEAQARIKLAGCYFLKFNWKKRTAHFITPGGKKGITSL